MDNKKKKQEQQKTKSKKVKKTAIAIKFLIPIMIAIIAASAILVIFDTVLDILKGAVVAVLKGFGKFLANPIKWAKGVFHGINNALQSTFDGTFDPGKFEEWRTSQLVIISQEEFNDIKKELNELEEMTEDEDIGEKIEVYSVIQEALNKLDKLTRDQDENKDSKVDEVIKEAVNKLKETSGVKEEEIYKVIKDAFDELKEMTEEEKKIGKFNELTKNVVNELEKKAGVKVEKEDDKVDAEDGTEEEESLTTVLGLDDLTLKKMLLTYNAINYSKNAEIVIQLSDEELDAINKDSNLKKPFEVKKGKKLEALKANAVQRFAKRLDANWFDADGYYFKIGSATYDLKEMQNMNFLYTKGNLTIFGSDGKELIYYPEETLDTIYKRFEKARNHEEAKSDYAKSVWEYLGKCYTDTVDGARIDGLAMYTHSQITEELVNWSYEDKDSSWWEFGSKVKINRKVIPNASLTYNEDKSIFNIIPIEGGLKEIGVREYNIQILSYFEEVSKYSTPIEFFVSLLEISGSPDFINAFMEMASGNTEIVLKVYTTESSQYEIKKEIVDERVDVLTEAVVEEYKVRARRVFKVVDEVTGETSEKEGDDIYDENMKVKVAWADNKTIKITVTGVPDEATRVYADLKLSNSEDGKWITSIRVHESGIFKWDAVEGNTCERYYTHDTWTGNELTRYSHRINGSAIVTREEIQLITTIKSDIAIESAKTWYGNVTYNNKYTTNPIAMSKNADGDFILVDVDNVLTTKRVGVVEVKSTDDKGNTVTKEEEVTLNDVEVIIKDGKTWIYDSNGDLKEIKLEGVTIKGDKLISVEADGDVQIAGRTADPIMVQKDPNDYTYTYYNDSRTTNYEDIFLTTMKAGFDSWMYAYNELGRRYDRWLWSRSAGSFGYWLTLGPLSRQTADWLGMDDKGFGLTTEEALLNLQFLHAIENGSGDRFNKMHYKPISMTITANDSEVGYQVGELIAIFESKLGQHLPETMDDNTDLFLSLLVDEKGNPKEYDNIYGMGQEVHDTTIVGDALVNNADLFFDLLEKYPSTHGLVDIMKYIFYRYNNQDFGVKTWSFNLFENAISI